MSSPIHSSNHINSLDGYPYYVYLSENKFIILLWIEGKNERDFLFTDNTGVLYIFTSKEQLETEVKNKILLHWDNPSTFYVKEFFTTLSQIKAEESICEPACAILLHGWNLFEDIGFTLNFMDKLPIYTELPPLTYQKIFAGNNFPAITPEGVKYKPIFNQEEATNFKIAMQKSWQYIQEIVPALNL